MTLDDARDMLPSSYKAKFSSEEKALKVFVKEHSDLFDEDILKEVTSSGSNESYSDLDELEKLVVHFNMDNQGVIHDAYKILHKWEGETPSKLTRARISSLFLKKFQSEYTHIRSELPIDEKLAGLSLNEHRIYLELLEQADGREVQLPEQATGRHKLAAQILYTSQRQPDSADLKWIPWFLDTVMYVPNIVHVCFFLDALYSYNYLKLLNIICDPIPHNMDVWYGSNMVYGLNRKLQLLPGDGKVNPNKFYKELSNRLSDYGFRSATSNFNIFCRKDKEPVNDMVHLADFGIIK